jgi:hypothetical protein
MSRFAIVCLFACVRAADSPADEIEDGIYALKSAGEGRTVKLNGGAEVILDSKRGGTWGSVAMRSLANDNSRFTVELRNVGRLVEQGAPATVVLMIDGVGMPFQSRSEHADGTLDLTFVVRGEEPTRRVAARLKVEAQRRQHPGHRIEVRWIPDKETYSTGEPVALTMEMRNVGDKPISFRNGGQQRGPRNNQFRFLAFRGHGLGKAVPDSGDPTNFGGIGSVQTLKPGETFRESVQLDKWFSLRDPDTYRITGLFQLELKEDDPKRWVSTSIWDDFAVGECLITVLPRQH